MYADGESQAVQREKPSASSSPACSNDSWLAGEEITYFSSAQLAMSKRRHRLLQKGISGAVKGTGFWQMGQGTVAADMLITEQGCQEHGQLEVARSESGTG